MIVGKSQITKIKFLKPCYLDNIRSLQAKGYKINTFTVYGAHQQEASGFDNIMKNRNLMIICMQN